MHFSKRTTVPDDPFSHKAGDWVFPRQQGMLQEYTLRKGRLDYEADSFAQSNNKLMWQLRRTWSRVALGKNNVK